MRERIYSNRIYVAAIEQGISGFRRPPILGLMRGDKYRKAGKPIATRRGIDLNACTFRMENGRLPDYQPRGSFDDACRFLDENPYAVAVVDPPVPAH